MLFQLSVLNRPSDEVVLFTALAENEKDNLLRT